VAQATLLLALGLGGSLHAEPVADDATRSCVANAASTAGIAACERAAQMRWREQLIVYHEALLSTLGSDDKARYQAAQEAWERFREAEFPVIDATLGGRDQTAGVALAEGAKTQLLQQRAAQLADYLQAVQAVSDR
jgi:uncharacterized protein YecT (DUF1311 family)